MGYDAAVLQTGSIPLYHQLKEIFIEKISGGEWLPGATIPAEGELCAEYGVSRGPVRQALDQLVREGLLTRKQGKGTWVLPTKIERSLGRLYSFTDLIVQQGLAPSARLLSFERIRAPRGLARTLGLAEGAALFKIVRLRMADQEPLVLETIYVPVAFCPALAPGELAHTPLYSLLQEHYGVPLVKARQYFEAVVTDAFEAETLVMPQGAPVLLLQNITYTAGERPVVVSKAIVRGDRLRYYVELPRIAEQVATPVVPAQVLDW